MGHLLGGWKFSPIFSAQSGLPLEVNVGSDCQAFGEVNCSSGTTSENALLLSPYKGGNSVHGTGTSLNLFANGPAEASQFRAPLVGLDNQTGGAGILRGLPTWNLDVSIGKEFRMTERLNARFIATFNNVLNHNQLNNPTAANLNIASPSTFGAISGQLNAPRQMEFGIRIGF